MERDPNVEKLGRDIVTRARDKALRMFEAALAGSATGVGALRPYADGLQALTPDQRHLARICVRVCVDQAIAELLGHLDEAEALNELSLTINGVDVVLKSDGLSASLHGRRGWFKLYSEFGDIDELPAATKSP